ncbi:hypothetical protein GGI35DRAFT_387286 [Trichoderma velutinum]
MSFRHCFARESPPVWLIISSAYIRATPPRKAACTVCFVELPPDHGYHHSCLDVRNLAYPLHDTMSTYSRSMNNNLLQPGIYRAHARKNRSLLAATHEKQRHYQPTTIAPGTTSNFRAQDTASIHAIPCATLHCALKLKDPLRWRDSMSTDDWLVVVHNTREPLPTLRPVPPMKPVLFSRSCSSKSACLNFGRFISDYFGCTSPSIVKPYHARPNGICATMYLLHLQAAQRYTPRFHLPALPARVEDAKRADCTTCFFFTTSKSCSGPEAVFT